MIRTAGRVWLLTRIAAYSMAFSAILLVMMPQSAVAAATAVLSFSLSSTTPYTNQDFGVDIKVNTGGQAISGADITFAMSSNLQYKSADGASSVLSTEVTPPTVSNNTIHLVRVTFDAAGYTGTNGQIIHLVFTPTSTGAGSLTFNQSASEVAATSDASNVLLSVTNASFTVTDAPAAPTTTTPPADTSSTTTPSGSTTSSSPASSSSSSSGSTSSSTSTQSSGSTTKKTTTTTPKASTPKSTTSTTTPSTTGTDTPAATTTETPPPDTTIPSDTRVALAPTDDAVVADDTSAPREQSWPPLYTYIALGSGLGIFTLIGILLRIHHMRAVAAAAALDYQLVPPTQPGIKSDITGEILSEHVESSPNPASTTPLPQASSAPNTNPPPETPLS